MNGWQRVGVIASAIWFIGAWVHAGNDQEMKSNLDRHYWYGICRDLAHDPAKAVEQSD
jgi:hypothetical protein